MASKLLPILVLLALTVQALAAPTGLDIVFNQTVTPPVAPAGSLTTAGGSFTTLVLNVTMQNPRWKAYVGNITGRLTLDDANQNTIYDWTLSTITGEVYASRNASIDWSSVECANSSTILAEESALNITDSKEDSINNTFNQTIHKGFYVGYTYIQNSTCRAIATYVNDSKQPASENADFQLVLLQSGSTLIYATLLEQDALSYDPNKTFDFQMIVAENEYSSTGTTYYFYAEIG